MITSLSVIVYIVSVTDERYNEKNVQKGVAISRIYTEDGYQVYRFTAYANSKNDLIDLDDNLHEVAQQLQQGGIYQISGKFTPAKDNSLNVTITTSIQLHIDEEHAPISKPIVHLIGNTTSYADITKAGYTLPIQVKPYLSKDQFQPYTIMLTHPTNGRLKNLTKFFGARNWNFVLPRKAAIL